MTAARRPSAPVVKLKPQTHAKLQEIAKQDDQPMGEVVTYLIDRYEQERFWMQAQEDLARLKADPEAWQEYMDELAFFDQSVGAGLEDEAPYYTPEEEEEILAEAARTKGG